MNIISTNDNNFESEVLNSNIPVLVDFWAEWCGPCRSLAPKLEEISNELHDKIKVVKVNIDENPKSPSQYNVKGIPTLILFKGGSMVEQIVGNHPKENIISTINKHI